jgi:ABC-2 type transport system permease protein
MAFLSGLWMPLAMLPKIIGQMAPLWPAYHLSQLALMTVGQVPATGIASHLMWLGGFTAICFAIARRWLARAG